MCSWWRVVHIKYNIAPCVTGLTKLTASRKHISNMARIAVCRHISFTSGAGDKGFYCGQNTQYILTGSSCLLENNSKLLHTSCVLKYKKNKPENNISINKHEKVIPTIPDIHVFGAEGEDMGIMPKRKAENLAREEDMKLVLVGTDDDTGIANYKIMTGKQLAEESKRMKQEKKADKKKETKIIRVSSKITAHDLENKINHASSLLEKNHPIRISIKQASGGAEKVCCLIFYYKSDC